MSHEQSETILGPDGRWINVYGRHTPRAGQQLPGTNSYSTVDEAVNAARARSSTFLGDEQSSSLGLKLRPNMKIFDDDYLFSTNAPTSSLVTEPSSGIGLTQPPAPVEDRSRQVVASPAAAPTQIDLRLQAIEKMSGFDKFFGALGDFGAALQGRESPLDRSIKMEQQAKMQKLQEFKIKTDAIEDSVKWATKLQGEDRERFVNVRAQQLNEQSPGLGDQFRVFSKQPDLVTRFRKYMEFLPEPMQIMMRANPDGFLKFAATSEGMKALSDANDKSVLRFAAKKARTALLGWDKFAPPDVVANYKRDGIITASEFMGAQKYVPEAVRLSEQEIEIAMRTPGFWQALNIAGPGEEAEARKKQLAEGPQSDVAKLAADLKAGRITQSVYKTKMRKLTHIADEGERFTSETISVDGKNLLALRNKAGNYIDPNTRRPIKGQIGPAIATQDQKAASERTGAIEKLRTTEEKIAQLEKLIEKNPRSVGGLWTIPSGVIEYSVGSFFPGAVDEPTKNALQLRNSIIAELYPASRSSNEERQRVESSLGIGAGGTPESAKRGVKLLKDRLRAIETEFNAPLGRAVPRTSGGKDYSSLSNEELLDALSGGK